MGFALIFDIKRYAIHDGPGIRTAVFFKGCPLSCLWCANPESQLFAKEFIFWPDRCLYCDACISACKKGAIINRNEKSKEINAGKCDFCGDCIQECHSEALQFVGRQIGVEELLREFKKDKDFYWESKGGVTFSGGEPFLQPDFLYQALIACKEEKLHTAIETCGFVPWEKMNKVMPFVDLFLYDLKLMDEKKHRRNTGVSNRLILANLEKLADTHRVIVRVPLIPRINDDEDNIRRMGEYLSQLKKIEEINLLPYHELGIAKYERLKKRYTLKNIKPPAPERIHDVKKDLEKFGFKVNVGG